VCEGRLENRTDGNGEISRVQFGVLKKNLS